MFSVYVVVNHSNNKVYVGQTEAGVTHRWTEHLYSARTGVKRYFYYALRKNEQAFTVSEIGRAHV